MVKPYIKGMWQMIENHAQGCHKLGLSALEACTVIAITTAPGINHNKFPQFICLREVLS